MNHLVDISKLYAAPLGEHVAGTLVLTRSETSSSNRPFWGLRFDSVSEDGPVRCIMWLNGMPWHGHDPAFFAMRLDESGYGRLVGVGCGLAKIEVDLASGAGRAGQEMRWDRAGGFIAATPRGLVLVAGRSVRQSMWGGYYAVDPLVWSDVADTHREHVAEWFSRWSLIVEGARDPLAISFDATAEAVSKAA